MVEIMSFVMQLVANRTRRNVDADSLTVPLDELGLTSIDLAEILFDIEEHFNVEIRLDHSRHELEGMLTLRQIAESLVSLLPHGIDQTVSSQ